MAYIGNQPAENYTSLTVQHFTVTATASYTLDSAVANENEIALFINNVRQQPGSSYAYTASSTALTLSEATAGTDTMYCLYLGKAQQTVTPPDGSVTDAKIVGMASSKLTGALPAIDGSAVTGITHTPADGSVTNVKTDFQPGTIFKGDGSSTDGKITINCSQNTHGVSIQSPTHASAASYTLTLPVNDGNASDFLQSDGSGVLSWTAVPPTADEITTQATAPTVSNPATPTQGDLILATTTQQLYCCKTVSVGANVWVNIGEGSGGVTPSYAVDFLCIAGGAGGGFEGGGGGAGGYRASFNSETSGGGGSSETALQLAQGTVYTITVGNGGAGGPNATTKGGDGGISSISGSDITDISSTGGGGGGTKNQSNLLYVDGNNGGSGGGDSRDANNATRATGVANQGNVGGHCNFASYGNGGGGGGSSSAGGDGAYQGTAGAGGDGVASTITAGSVTRAGGGGGGGWSSYAGGAGGSGGGGAGQTGSVGTAASPANSGSGGGAGGSSYVGGNGASGVVILRIATADYSGTSSGSPTITTSGSDTILLFTGNGSYTG